MDIKKKPTLKKIWHGCLATIGFLLSPLSWWNDIFVNIPLAYLFATPFSLIKKDFFLPAFVVGYLLTNVLGLILMHHGLKGLFNKKKDNRKILKDVIIALIYTLLIILLVIFGVVKSPQNYFIK